MKCPTEYCDYTLTEGCLTEVSVAEYCGWTLLLNTVTERYLTKHCMLSLVLLNNVLH